MRTERRRDERHSFKAMAEVVDEGENSRTSSKISDLSLHGCFVETVNPFQQGTNVMIEICTDRESLETPATVAFLKAKQGMGLTFRDMPESCANILHGWLKQARGKPAN